MPKQALQLGETALWFLFFQMTDMLNGKGQNVYRLPPPVSCPVGSAGEPVNLRIPPVEKSTESQVSRANCCATHSLQEVLIFL